MLNISRLNILTTTNNGNRTVLVWILIAQMVHIKTGVLCETIAGFRDVPLCAPKSLWEAKTRSAWQLEYEMYNSMPRMGLETLGDLVDVCRQSDVGANRLRLDAWTAKADYLGIMLSLGAAIL